MDNHEKLPTVSGDCEGRRDSPSRKTEQKQVCRDELSTRRFRAYIGRWRDALNRHEVHLPSARAPLEPVLPLASAIQRAGEYSGKSTTRVIKACDHPLLATPQSTSEQHICAKTTALVIDNDHHMHVSSDVGDYERPLRIEHAVDHLRAVGLYNSCCVLKGQPARTRDLLRVHTRDLVNNVDQTAFVLSLRGSGSATVGQDLYANMNTAKVARAAAGCVLEAGRAVMQGRAVNAFALTRPPGHHAGIDHSGGFCFFNNVAVAVRAIQSEAATKDGAQSGTATKPRILVLDWDVHHCDGTEQIFYEDPSVLVISIHQYANHKGHVLRRPHRERKDVENNKDAVDKDTSAVLSVEELAQLMSSDKRLETQTRHATGADERTIPTDGLATEKNSEMNDTRIHKRARPDIDYDALAQQLNAETQNDNLDQAAEAFFQLGAHESRLSSEATTSDTTTRSDSSRSEAPLSRSNKRFPGDTTGMSTSDDTNADDKNRGKHDADAEANLFYPATGHHERLGGEVREDAKGYNINIPWPTHGMGDLEYMLVMLNVVGPICNEFQPEYVFVSCGFDSARGDLLGSMNLTPSGYYVMTKFLASRCPKLIIALEGGYNARNVALCSEAVIRALLQASGHTNNLPPSNMLWEQTLKTISRVRSDCAPYWKCMRKDT